MSELVPAADVAQAPRASLLAPLTDPAGGSFGRRLSAFSAQDPVRRMLPWFVGIAALGGLALTWAALAPSPQRTLYSQLDDGERASVVDALDKAAIPYEIDNATGQISVNEGDFYRARMLVASDGGLALPQSSGTDMLDSLPMGASRTLEGERLRAQREHDLMLTIMEIDGVESVRVHLAEGEKSVFVRDNLPPSASVMLRLARGRSLSDKQVSAIVNLVAGSVPGLSPDAVRVVDQQGRLLSDYSGGGDSDRLELQARIEEKLRNQVAQLLTPMFGEGNFTSEIQVELDMNEVTSARESYDKDGAVRTETEQQSQTTSQTPAVGVPGVLANTPPPAAAAQPGPPQGTQATATQPPVSTDTSATRTYEVGRAVSVSNSAPGGVKRLSVAVALSAAATKGAKPADIEQIKQLVSAAVGADAQRGDQVAVVARKFEPASEEALAFYETPWFATLVRNGAALLGLLLALLFGVRPLIRALKRPTEEPAEEIDYGVPEQALLAQDAGRGARPVDPALLSEKVGLAQRLVAEKPDSALAALRQMLNPPQTEAEATQ